MEGQGLAYRQVGALFGVSGPIVFKLIKEVRAVGKWRTIARFSTTFFMDTPHEARTADGVVVHDAAKKTDVPCAIDVACDRR